MQAHTESAVKRRDPGIQTLARKYNKLVTAICELIDNGKAPARTLHPNPIDMESLFALDVDDDIWQDIGLEDDSFDTQVPGWLGDESIRAGIKAQLILDRCMEERDRLSRERWTMQIWMQEEWKALEHAIANTGECIDLCWK